MLTPTPCRVPGTHAGSPPSLKLAQLNTSSSSEKRAHLHEITSRCLTSISRGKYLDKYSLEQEPEMDGKAPATRSVEPSQTFYFGCQSRQSRFLVCTAHLSTSKLHDIDYWGKFSQPAGR